MPVAYGMSKHEHHRPTVPEVINMGPFVNGMVTHVYLTSEEKKT